MAMRYYAPLPGGGGDPLRPRGQHTLRVGDAEREAAAADLGEHYAAGRLTLDELDERLDAVFSAKTFGQLATVMTDLPGPGRLPWRTGPYRPGASTGRGPHDFRDQPTSGDQRGGLAALSLLLLAMLIWLFTALLFAGHGFYHPGPYGYGPYGHYTHTLQYDSPVAP